MRRMIGKQLKPQQYDLSPWINNDSTERNETEKGGFNELRVQRQANVEEQDAYRLLTKTNTNCSGMKKDGDFSQWRTPQYAKNKGRTLALAKEYMRRNYTEQKEAEVQEKKPYKGHREKSVKTEGSKTVYFGKASIIDLSSSFSEQCPLPKRAKSTGQQLTLKVLRLRQKLMKSKSSDKKEKKQLHIQEQIRPKSSKRVDIQPFFRQRCSTATKRAKTESLDGSWACLNIRNSSYI